MNEPRSLDHLLTLVLRRKIIDTIRLIQQRAGFTPGETHVDAAAYAALSDATILMNTDGLYADVQFGDAQADSWVALCWSGLWDSSTGPICVPIQVVGTLDLLTRSYTHDAVQVDPSTEPRVLAAGAVQAAHWFRRERDRHDEDMLTTLYRVYQEEWGLPLLRDKPLLALDEQSSVFALFLVEDTQLDQLLNQVDDVVLPDPVGWAQPQG